MIGVDATERTRKTLQRLAREKTLRQSRLAARLGVAASAVNRSIHGPTPITVTFLEAVEADTGIPLAEIVAPPGTTYQLDADEAALIRAFRKWPKSVVHALLAFLAPFVDEGPTETRTRNLHEYWRRMPARDQEWIYGIVVMLREGMLPPDVRAGLVRHLEAELAKRKSRGSGRDESR